MHIALALASLSVSDETVRLMGIYGLNLGPVIGLGVLLVVACLMSGLPGQGWFIGYAAMQLMCSTMALYSTRLDGTQFWIQPWFRVNAAIGNIALFCFVMFMMVTWCRHRGISIRIKDLLFSFSGRVPRSLHWIMLVGGNAAGVPMASLFLSQQIVTQEYLRDPFLEKFTSHIAAAHLSVVIICFLWFIFSIWILIAVYSKRWHDIGKSGWMTLLLLIPIVGPFWLLWQLGFVSGNAGANWFGADPLAGTSHRDSGTTKLEASL